MDATELLRNDHDAVRRLFQAIENAEDDVDARRELFTQVADALRIHSRIEETIFYPRVQQLGRGGDTEGDDKEDEGGDLVTEAMEEHHEVDKLLHDIETMDASRWRWKRRVKKLQRRVDHHADEEEREMFPFVRRHMTQEAREQLGAELEERKAELDARSPNAPVVGGSSVV